VSDGPERSLGRSLPAAVIAVAAAVVFAVFCLSVFGGEPGADIVPLWVAARLWAAGMPEAIYAADTTVFTLAAPETFTPLARAVGYEGSVYPFLYPPIWAALLAPLTEAVDAFWFDAFFRTLNAVALVMVPWLMWRAAPVVPFGRHFALGAMLLLVTTVGFIPIMANQVQILVAFLLALTIERSRNGGEVAAGVALGLAAALKLYPALFALLFLGLRQPRAFLAFAVTGGALGLASLALAGWPMHLALLEQLSTVSRTVLRVNLSMNLDALLAILSEAPGAEVRPGVVAIEKSAAWVAADRALLIGYVLALSLTARTWRGFGAHPLFWPAALLGTALLGPLSWAYYYITPLAAAPFLLALWTPMRTALTLSSVAVSVSLTVIFPVPTPYDAPPMQFWGTLALLALWAGILATLARQGTRPLGTEVRALHPGPQSL
jgi:hypothetical protein